MSRLGGDGADLQRHAPYNALYRLWEVFLYMRAWGLPEYNELPKEAREGFAELVATGRLFAYVEDCKRDVLAAGVDLPNEWLSVLYALHVSAESPLPEDERDHLGRILTAMYPMLCRLDPAVTARGDGKEDALSDKPSSDGRQRQPARARVKELVISYLVTHHKYDNGSVGHWEPIGIRELANNIRCNPGHVSRIMKKLFKKGYETYEQACTNGTLAIALTRLVDPNRFIEELGDRLEALTSEKKLYRRGQHHDPGLDME